MRLIVSSKDDKASMNILSQLLEYDWEEIGEWKGNTLYRKNNNVLATVNKHHIYVDDIDKQLNHILDVEFDNVVFISKHASEAGVHSLTVHPIGNFGEAKFGGLDNKLVPPSPHRMTTALRVLWDKAEEKGLRNDYEVSFEATHHGPYLETPTYYIEIGSDKSSWTDERAGEVIASTLFDVEEHLEKNNSTLVGIGGGHYAPRFTEIARHKSVSIGHMVPGWALRYMNEDNFLKALELSQADYIYFDRGSIKEKNREKISNWARKVNIETIRSEDLPDL